jgi:hypothetical protein
LATIGRNVLQSAISFLVSSLSSMGRGGVDQRHFGLVEEGLGLVISKGWARNDGQSGRDKAHSEGTAVE